MNVGDFIKDNWTLISDNPITFILFGIIVITTTVFITKSVLGSALEAARERLAGAQDEIKRLQGEKEMMFQKLEQHGEDITKLKEELNTRPRIFTSKEPPKDAKGGDFWFQIDD